MIKNRFIIFILLIFSVVCCVCGFACGGKDNPEPDGKQQEEPIPEQEEPSISLNYKQLSVYVHESVELKAFLKNITGVVVWSSTDEDIVIVDQNGCITAQKEGNAAIKATIGDNVATCTVYVVNDSSVPKMVISDQQISVAKNGTYSVEIQTLFRENVVKDAIEYTWTLIEGAEDTVSLETADGGSRTTIKGLNFGKVKYYISATVYGIYLVEEVNVSVVDSSVSFDFKNVNLDTEGYFVQLSTKETEDYKNSTTVNVDLYVNNQITENAGSSLTWESENAEIATVSGGVITAVSKGTTYITVSYGGNETRIKVIVVIPVAQVVDYDNKVSVDKSEDGSYSVDMSSYILGNERINGVSVAGFEYSDYDYENGTVSLNKELLRLNKIYGEQTLNVSIVQQENGVDVSYKIIAVPLLVITNTLRNKADFNAIASLSKAESDNALIWGGYFLLGNDIEFNGTFNSFISWTKFDSEGKGKSYYANTDLGFVGTFDGNGFCVDGLTMPAGSSGLFGAISTSAVIKNVAFINVKLSGGASLICESGDGTIENVYVQCVEQMHGWAVNDGQKSGFFFTYFSGANAVIKNCFVETNISNASSTGVHPLGLGTVATENNLINAYCVGCTVGAVVFNDKATFIPYDNRDGYGAYETYADFKSNVSDLSLFDNDFWTINNGLPVPAKLIESGKYLVSYVVKHYKESGLNTGDYSILAETEILHGYSGNTTEASAKSYLGYSALDFSQNIISDNGDTVVNIYYRKLPNYYTVNHLFAKDDGTHYTLYDSEKIYAESGARTTATAVNVEGFTAKPFSNETVLDEYRTVINIYYTKDATIENFEGIVAGGEVKPVAASKLVDDEGYGFNIFVNNVAGLKYSVVNDSFGKALKFENVNRNNEVGTWIGIMLTAQQYEIINGGGALYFDIKTDKDNGYYTENKSLRTVNIGKEWTTVVITKTMGATIFPTPNAAYGQYIYFMYGFTPDSTVWIDNIRTIFASEYTVNHYLYKTTDESDGYYLYKTESFTGAVGQLTEAQALSLYNYTAQPFSNVAIGEDTTINIYYNRDSMLIESAEYNAIRNYHWFNSTAILATDYDAQDLTNFYIAPLDNSSGSMVSGRDGHGKAVKFNIVGSRWVGMLLTAEQSAALANGGTLKFWAKADSETTVTQSGGGDLTITIGTTWAEYTVPLSCYSNISASNVNGQQRYWIYTPGDCVIYIDDITVIPNL